MTPVGGAQSVPVNFRLICATNRNLKQEIADGNFRADLFYRINVFPVEIPPLRSRPDFADVAHDLWREARSQVSGLDSRSRDSGNKQRDLTADEMELLKACPWPGNVRQLKNVLQRYTVLKPYDVTLTEILTQEFSLPKLCDKNICSIYVTDFLKKRKKKPTFTDIEETLLLCKGNKCKAAKKLGISRGSLCYQLQKGRVKVAS